MDGSSKPLGQIISCCDLCPNATVRGNQLVPVCLWDYPDLKGADELLQG